MTWPGILSACQTGSMRMYRLILVPDPGKMKEELFLSNESIVRTDHEKINILSQIDDPGLLSREIEVLLRLTSNQEETGLDGFMEQLLSVLEIDAPSIGSLMNIRLPAVPYDSNCETALAPEEGAATLSAGGN